MLESPHSEVLSVAGHTHGGLSCFPAVVELFFPWLISYISDTISHHVRRITHIDTWHHINIQRASANNVQLPIPGINALKTFAHTYGLTWASSSPQASSNQAQISNEAQISRLRKKLAVYTNSGLTQGHPARWFCPAEIVFLHLVPEQ